MRNVKFNGLLRLTILLMIFSIASLYSCGGGGGGGGESTHIAITNFAPTNGVPGTAVTITGTDFPTNLSDINITLCGVQATTESATSTQIIFTVPSMNASSCLITLATSNGTISSVNSFEIKTIPTTTLPSEPTGLKATAGNGQVNVSWNSVSGATSYNLYWSTMSGVTKTNGAKISDVASPYIHLGLTNNTTYYYVATAVNSYGESIESAQVSATPTSGYTNPVTKNATTLADTASLNGSFDNPPGYTTAAWFEYGTTASYGHSTDLQYYNQSGNINVNANIGGLQVNTTYHFRIVIQNASGTFYGDDNTFSTFLISGLNNPRAIAIDSSSVYWTERWATGDGAVKKVGINGSAVTTLASGLNCPGAIAVDSTSIYWIEECSSTCKGAVKKVGINGGTIATLASGLTSPRAITI